MQLRDDLLDILRARSGERTLYGYSKTARTSFDLCADFALKDSMLRAA